MKKYERIPSYRRYWNQPGLVDIDQKLSKKQKRKITEKFLQLAEKARRGR